MVLKKQEAVKLAAAHGCGFEYGTDQTFIEAKIGPGGYGHGRYYAVGTVAVVEATWTKDLITENVVIAACTQVKEIEAGLAQKVRDITEAIRQQLPVARQQIDAFLAYAESPDKAAGSLTTVTYEAVKNLVHKRDILVRKIGYLEKSKTQKAG